MATTALNYESILNDAAEKLEARFSEIQGEIAPLREEEREVAEAINRLVGSYPQGYNGRSSTPSGSRRAPRSPGTPAEDREAAIIAFIAQHPEGTTAKALADELGISSNTLNQTLAPMLETGSVRSEGERRGRKLLPPK